MAKRKKRGTSIAAYFQKLFTDYPHLLKVKSNEEAFKRYRADHGLAEDAPISQKVRNALSNKKSLMNNPPAGANGRKKGRPKGKGGKMAGVATGASAARMHFLE